MLLYYYMINILRHWTRKFRRYISKYRSPSIRWCIL